MRSIRRTFLVFCMLAVFGAAGAVRADDDHEIPSAPDPTPTAEKGGRAVDPAPRANLGVNGKLKWEGRDLFLTTPLGKKYQLYSNVDSVKKKLTELAEKNDQNIEIEGWTIPGKEGAMNVREVSRADGDYNGMYVLHFDRGALQGASGVELKDALKKLAGISLKGHFAGDDFLSIQSDLSLAQMRRVLAANPKISDKVERIERDPVVRANGR